MPTIDERVREYAHGWSVGADWGYRDGGCPYESPQTDYERGYNAGRVAYFASEQAERARLERCPVCGGTKRARDPRSSQWFRYIVCPDCHGTGRRA